MQELKKIVGGRIKELRIKLELTQEELAERTSLHPSYIGIIERGDRNASFKSLIKISEALGVNIDYFFKPTKTKKTEKDLLAKEILTLIKNKNPEDIKFVIKILKLFLERLKNK